jgi:Zn-dependent alcohol dehydrogenase
VAVYGLGGLGLSAALILDQVVGARVIGVDVRESALACAASRGLTDLVRAEGVRSSEVVHGMTDGGVDASFEFVGRVDTTEQALRSLRPPCFNSSVTSGEVIGGRRSSGRATSTWTRGRSRTAHLRTRRGRRTRVAARRG